MNKKHVIKAKAAILKNLYLLTKIFYYTGTLRIEIIPNEDSRKLPELHYQSFRLWNPIMLLVIMIIAIIMFVCSPFVENSIQQGLKDLYKTSISKDKYEVKYK